MTTLQALESAKSLLGCFRTGDAGDPETYSHAIAAVLSMYSADVVQYVCDPRTGLPCKLKWMPSVSEVRSACDEHADFIFRIDQAAIEKERMRDQGRLPPPPEKPRPTLAEMIEKYGKNWGLGATEEEKKKTIVPGPTPEQVVEHYKTHGFARQPKSSLLTPEAIATAAAANGEPTW